MWQSRRPNCCASNDYRDHDDCGAGDDYRDDHGDSDDRQPTPTTTEPTSTLAPTMVDVKVYFLRGERLAISHRQVAGPAVFRGALRCGPRRRQERAAGIHTEIPGNNVPRRGYRPNRCGDRRSHGDYESSGGSSRWRALRR